MSPDENCSGYCIKCQMRHSLPSGRALEYARGVLQSLRTRQRLDYWKPHSQADPRLSFDAVFNDKNGHMFGVMETIDSQGRTHWLRAFSSLKGGLKYVDGWVPPILPRSFLEDIVLPGEGLIKDLTQRMSQLQVGSAEHAALPINDAASRKIL